VSFRKGSAGGLDSLKPQILKDLLHVQNGDAGRKLLESITALTTVILNGEVPSSLCPYFFGASLTALMKKTGGIRPIAVGNTWRRLVAKQYRSQTKISGGARAPRKFVHEIR